MLIFSFAFLLLVFFFFYLSELFTTLQCIHMVSSRPLVKRVGVPLVLALPTEELDAMPMRRLRAIVRDAVAPWINQGRGWGADDRDTDLYDICLMDRAAENVIEVLPFADADGSEDHTMPLLSTTRTYHARNRVGGVGMSFGLEWKLAPDALAAKLIDDAARLSLPAHIAAARASAPKKTGLDVSDCLAAFSKEETLRKSEAWYCSKSVKQHR